MIFALRGAPARRLRVAFGAEQPPATIVPLIGEEKFASGSGSAEFATVTTELSGTEMKGWVSGLTTVTVAARAFAPNERSATTASEPPSASVGS